MDLYITFDENITFDETESLVCFFLVIVLI